MSTLTDWLRGRTPPLEGEIDPTYTEADRANAPQGHLPYPGSNVEVVSYREGLDLIVLVNKGPCIFRTRLVGAFRDDHDTMALNMLMRDERIELGETPEALQAFADRIGR